MDTKIRPDVHRDGKKFEITDTVLQPLEDRPATAEDLDIGAGPNFREREPVSQPGPQQETGMEERTQEPRETPAKRPQKGDISGPRRRLHRPWQEAQADQIPRHGQTCPQTRSKTAYERHRLRDPVVGAWGDPDRRMAERGARWITDPVKE